MQPSLNLPSRPFISGFVKLALEWSRRGKINIEFSDEPLGTQSALSQINAATCHWQSCLESKRRDRIGWVYAGDVVPVSMSCAVSFLVLFVMSHISAKPRGETSRVTVGAVGGVAGWGLVAQR